MPPARSAVLVHQEVRGVRFALPGGNEPRWRPARGQCQQGCSLAPGDLQHRWAKRCIGVMRIEGRQAVWLGAERNYDGSMPALPSCQREGVAGKARSPWFHFDDTNRRDGSE